MGLNIFGSFSVGSYFPFKYLNNNVIESSATGVLLSENFDEKKLFKTFPELWMRKKGTAKKELSPDGLKGSRCFSVKNSSSGSWVSSYRKKIEVKKGDLFYMKGFTKITGDRLRAVLSIAAFDRNNDVINWNLLRSETNITGKWIKLEKQFVIPDDNIRFIRFRIAGVGKGYYLFDNIVFRKLN